MSVVLLCHLSENMWGLENSRVGRLWGGCKWLRSLVVLVRCSPRTSTSALCRAVPQLEELKPKPEASFQSSGFCVLHLI